MSETLFIDDADYAVIGCIERCGQTPIVIYDYDKLVTHFCSQGMTYCEAEEWVQVNIVGAWVGEGTPGVLFSRSADEIREGLGL